MGVKVLQQVQARVFHVAPIESTGSVTMATMCTNILLEGMFMQYFGASGCWRRYRLCDVAAHA